VLLLGASVLSVATGGVGDAVVILDVVGLNAVIGTVTESRVETSIQSLMRMKEPMCAVVLDGELKTISGDQVVLGDVLLLSRG
jgi:Ca2+-transporting ATPase